MVEGLDFLITSNVHNYYDFLSSFIMSLDFAAPRFPTLVFHEISFLLGGKATKASILPTKFPELYDKI